MEKQKRWEERSGWGAGGYKEMLPGCLCQVCRRAGWLVCPEEKVETGLVGRKNEIYVSHLYRYAEEGRGEGIRRKHCNENMSWAW